MYDPRPVLKVTCAALLCLVSVSLAAGDASAQEMTEEERLERFTELVSQAKEAYTGEDYERAIELLQRANILRPDSRVLLNIARSYEKMDRCAEAIAYYEAVLRDPELDSKVKKIASKATRKAKKCEGYDPEGSGRVVVLTQPNGAMVYIDGDRLGAAPVETIMLPAGTHSLKIEMDGYETLEKEISLETQRDLIFEEELEEEKPDPVPDPDPEPDPDPDPILPPEEDEKSLNIPAIALMGAGVVGLGAGLGIDLVAIPGIDEERTAVNCEPPNDCDPDEYDRLTDKRKSRANLALISYIGGGVLLAGGAGWFIYDMVAGGEQDDPSKVQLMPVFGAERAGVMMRWRF